MAQHKNEALETALDRALSAQAAQSKLKPSPQEYEEQVLQFLNALLEALPEKKPE